MITKSLWLKALGILLSPIPHIGFPLAGLFNFLAEIEDKERIAEEKKQIILKLIRKPYQPWEPGADTALASYYSLIARSFLSLVESED